MQNTSDIKTNPYKADYPLLSAQNELSYLDNAATEQRPLSVIKAQEKFYTYMNANPLRGLYGLSVAATQSIDEARNKVATFIGAKSAKEIIFCRNTTEALNLCAQSLGSWLSKKGQLAAGDEILISIAEHHSNLIPWQQLAKATGATLRYLYLSEHFSLTQKALEEAFSPRTKIVACTQLSNVLGTSFDIKAIAKIAHKHGALCVVDAAQSIPHMNVSVTELDCDFLAFSGHKLGAPFGVGVLWGKADLLTQLPPVLFGGEMIDSVTQTDAVWAEIPAKFEAGTQDGAGIVGLGAAIDYLCSHGRELLFEREQALSLYLFEQLNNLPYIKILGSPKAEDHHGVVSFAVKGVHPHDVASILDMNQVAIRAGHHCAQPLLTWLGYESCCRASVAFYNDMHDVDALIQALNTVKELFHVLP